MFNHCMAKVQRGSRGSGDDVHYYFRVMMMFITITARAKARRGDGEYGRLYEGANFMVDDLRVSVWHGNFI